MPDNLIKQSAAARLLRYSPGHFSNLLKSGKIDLKIYYRPGSNRRLFDRKEIESYIENSATINSEKLEKTQ